jgi:hypothetical protein
MRRALVLGATALTLSAGATSAQAVYPGYGYAPYGYGGSALHGAARLRSAACRVRLRRATGRGIVAGI